MKVNKEAIYASSFQPFRLSIEVQTEEEAKALYAIFNLLDNHVLLGENKAEKLKDAIGHGHYVEEGNIANGISYRKFYYGEE